MEPLYHLANESVSDFDRICSVLGYESLSAKEFLDILQSCGFLKDAQNFENLFDRLVSMCREAEAVAKENGSLIASEALVSDRLDSNALRNLYKYHPSYTSCKDQIETARALTGFLKELFEISTREQLEDDFSTDGLSLSRHGTRQFVKRLSLCSKNSSRDNTERSTSSSTPDIVPVMDSDSSSSEYDSEEDTMLDESVHKLIAQSQHLEADGLDLETLAATLLRYNKGTATDCVDHKTLFSGKLAERIFDPLHTTPNEFVSALDAAVLGHDALHHHVLDSFSVGSFGCGFKGNVSRLADFMQAYRHFTSTFCTHLEATIEMVGEADPTGKYRKTLEENMEEEQGIYGEEDIAMIELLGLDADRLRNVPHRELYVRCYEGLRRISGSNTSFTEEQCGFIAEPLVNAFAAACDPSLGATAATAIASMYLGSELIVSKMYGKLSNYVTAIAKEDNEESPLITEDDLAFFLLHIHMDVDHADKMRAIVVDLASDEATRLRITAAVHAILEARKIVWDRFLETVVPPTGHGGEDSAKLYNKQSKNWVRNGATCLSDFTGRPIVFEACAPWVIGAHVLDVGCGEGYGARRLVAMGAKSVLGLDISGEMIERAKANPQKSDKETYEACDAEKVVETLFKDKPASLGLVPGRMLQQGCFDLATAIFLFNYTSIGKMKNICEQVYTTLKPGGHFVFSVPHPFMLHAHGSSSSSSKTKSNGENEPSTFSFSSGEASSGAYFSLRDRRFAGVIRTLDGKNLNVKMFFKAISDYTETLKAVGFDIQDMKECRVLQEHVGEHPEFFESVKDSPLHIVFDVVKPATVNSGKIPKALKWSALEKANADKILVANLPALVFAELREFTASTYSEGITHETFAPTARDAEKLQTVAAFARELRDKLSKGSGAVRVTGLDLGALGGKTDQDTEGMAKLAYFVLSSLIGRVDGGSRGKLFDVRDKGLDTSQDNVLFSVSSKAATHHTDGASADKAHDAVGLMCLVPSFRGGTLHLSSATNALEVLKQRLPKFLLHELLRPLPRDVLESGGGTGVHSTDHLLQLSRNPQLLAHRIRHNAYPVFEQDEGASRLRFRYMRQWIESGHQKAGLGSDLPPLLETALDALDDALREETIASLDLQPGEIIYCNNASLAHARDAFVDGDSAKRRHMVRVWIKLGASDN